jgi:hypothetical protein
MLHATTPEKIYLSVVQLCASIYSLMHTRRSVTRLALLQNIRSSKQLRELHIVFSEDLRHGARLTDRPPQIVAGTIITLTEVRAAVAAAQAKDAQTTAKTEAAIIKTRPATTAASVTPRTKEVIKSMPSGSLTEAGLSRLEI